MANRSHKGGGVGSNGYASKGSSKRKASGANAYGKKAAMAAATVGVSWDQERTTQRAWEAITPGSLSNWVRNDATEQEAADLVDSIATGDLMDDLIHNEGMGNFDAGQRITQVAISLAERGDISASDLASLEHLTGLDNDAASAEARLAKKILANANTDPETIESIARFQTSPDVLYEVMRNKRSTPLAVAEALDRSSRDPNGRYAGHFVDDKLCSAAAGHHGDSQNVRLAVALKSKDPQALSVVVAKAETPDERANLLFEGLQSMKHAEATIKSMKSPPFNLDDPDGHLINFMGEDHATENIEALAKGLLGQHDMSFRQNRQSLHIDDLDKMQFDGLAVAVSQGDNAEVLGRALEARISSANMTELRKMKAEFDGWPMTILEKGTKLKDSTFEMIADYAPSDPTTQQRLDLFRDERGRSRDQESLFA